ncbi:Lecithin:cholesterol acyltransferase-domain-containing protein [Boletus reticuloceps]|uniref:Lecithin:cholesterol acyltransferase-domain-containing protein n=1 Tax=Boletus reticuloceps TaxID=495285 RepID=A0A8I2Z1A2_9AGAM|nr:Lecithin:cholesterol acyltransferase-domain-containing protein [Boletus reticuloceps]
MPLLKRPKTWSVGGDESAQSSDHEHSDVGSHALGTLRDAQQEAGCQAMLYEAQVHESKKGPKRRFFFKARFLFPLGIILGVLLGFILVQPYDIQEMHTSLLLLIQEYDISLRLPEIDFSRVQVEWVRLRSNIPEVWKLNNDGREFQVGETMKERDLTARYPVVIIPGIISTSLESWSTSPEYRPFFREKVWGGFNMLSQVVFNRERWMAAMMLDSDTGLDTPGAKVRAAEGINAASNFMTGYWIWAKIIENLAVVGYDTNNLYLAAYDWRLSMWNLEERDGYFSKLKIMIEGLKKRQGKKVVITAHSMGATVALYFFKWVESPAHGGGGPDWVENHIETFLSIGGAYLGTAKAMSAFLSGEMRDTVEMNPVGAYVLERFFSRSERQQLFRSWAGSASLWVKGGDTIWGNETWAPDDEPEASHSHGALISFRRDLVIATDAGAEQTKNMTAERVGNWILERTPSSFQKMLSMNYSFGIERDGEVLARNDFDHRKWSNPLEIRLPNAPSMKFICVYGHGKETERSYWYAHAQQVPNESLVDTELSKAEEAGSSNVARTPLDSSRLRSSWIDAEYTSENLTPKVRNGVKIGEGDGTVGLLSMGAMCVEGWKRPRWNPARINVTTVELPHRPVSNMPRGGANTSDHIDILGSTTMNEIILKVATGVGHEIEESFVSRIREYAQQINWD